MSNLIKTSSDRLIKIGGKLVKINGGNTPMEQNAPGLYDEDGNFVKTWDELVSEGLVTVSE